MPSLFNPIKSNNPPAKPGRTPAAAARRAARPPAPLNAPPPAPARPPAGRSACLHGGAAPIGGCGTTKHGGRAPYTHQGRASVRRGWSLQAESEGKPGIIRWRGGRERWMCWRAGKRRCLERLTQFRVTVLARRVAAGSTAKSRHNARKVL